MNDRIYTIGGTTAVLAPVTQTVEKYNPAANRWTRRLDMPTACDFVQSGEVHGEIYALGGGVADIGSNILITVEEFDVGVVSISVEPMPMVALVWAAIKNN